jgi:hypothetical protein
MLDRSADEQLLTIAANPHCGKAGGATNGARFLRCVVSSLRSLDHFGRNDTRFSILLVIIPISIFFITSYFNALGHVRHRVCVAPGAACAIGTRRKMRPSGGSGQHLIYNAVGSQKDKPNAGSDRNLIPKNERLSARGNLLCQNCTTRHRDQHKESFENLISFAAYAE